MPDARPGSPWHESGDLRIGRLLALFAVMAVVLLAALAIAPVRSHFTEWREAQRRYNERAAMVGVSPARVGIKQIYRPELGVVDRCTSCHLGMGEVDPDPHVALYRAHPRMPHETGDFGCTTCHGGQGRGTTERAAHGRVPHWDEPMHARPYFEAGCGSCHTGLAVPQASILERGRDLFAQNACFDCHVVDGKGRGNGPDLSYVGLAGFADDWHDQHARAGASGALSGFAEVAAADRPTLDRYLRALVGAPRLVEGKALSLQLGCRGCHKIGGVGGEEAADLSEIGLRVASELDMAGVRGAAMARPPAALHGSAGGPPDLGDWMKAHFLDPARVVPDSTMPVLPVTGAQAELLTVYMLSLRPVRLPESLLPRDRVRAAVLGERDLPSDGAGLYATFCSGCHGSRGGGSRVGVGGVAFPAIGHPDFLSVADDGFLVATISNGRPGRRMPGWSREGGLTPADIGAVLAHLRGLAPRPPARAEVLAARADAARGAAMYARDCATCHGAVGEGTGIGSPLAARDADRSTGALFDALVSRRPGMGDFAAYDAAAMRSVIAHVQSLPEVSAPRAAWSPVTGDVTRGGAHFVRMCAGCHGEGGVGREAPALANPMFQSAATPGFLSATIVRGRRAVGMPGFGAPGVDHAQLDAASVADLAAFVLALTPQTAPPATPKPTPTSTPAITPQPKTGDRP
jgi:mono/diheme cytochrome c family protein